MAQTRALKSAASAATGLLTVAAAALALAGCGGSSAHNSASSSASAANGSAPSASVDASAGQSSGKVITGTSGSKSKSSAASSGGSGGSAADSSKSTGGSNGKPGAKSELRAVDVVSKPGPHKARGGPDEPQVPQTKGPNPCRLVSVHEASSILGASVSQTEAPLGPTCIMKVDSQKQVITLAVEAVSVKTQVKNMREVQTAVVGGHQTYCGKLGSSQFYLSLGGGKAIAVTAPCPVARALAATALSHLKA